MIASHQKSIESHMIYECPDKEAHAKYYCALMDVAEMDKTISSLKITKFLGIRMIHIHLNTLNNIS